jgi:quercetin dioxygenase-like cupin family protein
MTTPLPPSESAFSQQLAREGLKPARWSNGPDAVYGVHDHPYGKVLVVEQGSITFTIDGGRKILTMKRGDRLDLPPRTPHSAVVGPEGVVCLEAHVRPKRTR